MADHGDAGDGLVGVHAHHHHDAALGAGGGDLHNIAVVGAGGGHGIQLHQLAALRGSRRGHVVGDVQLVAELAALGGHSAHGDAGVLRIDGGDLVGGHVVDQTQQGGHNEGNNGQGAGDLENKLTGDLHYFAASFFSFLGAP